MSLVVPALPMMIVFLNSVQLVMSVDLAVLGHNMIMTVNAKQVVSVLLISVILTPTLVPIPALYIILQVHL